MSTDAITGPGRQSIYTGRVTNWPMVAASGIALVPVLFLGQNSNGRWLDLAAPLLLAAIGVIAYALTGSSVRTTAGPRGVTVHFGVLGWPRCTYPLDQIARAEVIQLHSWFVAGGFWWTPRRTCCTVRSGPTLRLILHNGRSVTVSTPDPHTAAAVIQKSTIA